MTKIYGECVCGGRHKRVTISDLGSERCFVALPGRDRPDGELELWIGAIGPIGITADVRDDQGFTARFKTPLEPAIIAHFNA